MRKDNFGNEPQVACGVEHADKADSGQRFHELLSVFGLGAFFKSKKDVGAHETDECGEWGEGT